MALAVVGAGFGRTGTLSLKGALETLGLGPCYHMTEVFAHPEHVAVWRDATEGRPVDWDALFAGYGACVDWPACAFWRELAWRWPEAKVILTVRDPQRWYESVAKTIHLVMQRELPDDAPEPVRAHLAMVRRLIEEETFDGRFEDRDHAIAVYEAHNRAVREAVPPERLLVYEVAEGWEPLCRFLDRPVPAEPFPRVNSTDEFRERFLARF
ncbi:MAG: sulfotransferase [Myxococcota bacterium]|nr:sulfotransferase [Myxococcota bacterium]